MSLLATQRRSHSAGPTGQGKFSCPVGQQDTGTACPTIVQISSDVLSSVEPQCSVTDFSSWNRKCHPEATCCSTSICLRLKNLSSYLKQLAWGDPGYSHVSPRKQPHCPSFSPCDLEFEWREVFARGRQRELVMIPVTSPWCRYRGHGALMLLGPVSCVFSLAPLM